MRDWRRKGGDTSVVVVMMCAFCPPLVSSMRRPSPISWPTITPYEFYRQTREQSMNQEGRIE